MAIPSIPICIDVEEAKLSNWKVRKEDAVFEGQIIAEIVYTNSNNVSDILVLRAPQSGYIKSLGLAEGEIAKKDNPIAEIVLCLHPVEYGGMCSVCGKNISNSNFIGHAHPHISVSKKEAERIEAEIATRLLKHKKLSLVLDLDNTLIHATVEHELNKEEINSEDVFQFTLPPNPLNYFVKLRPGLMKFLHKLRNLYELHIYTMGTRQYATTIAEIFDKTGEMFQEHRIVSRDDVQDQMIMAKNLTRLFPCDDTMVVIIDDREDVWISNGQVSPNLLRIEPFHFFKTTRELNALPGDKIYLSTNHQEEMIEDDNLHHMLHILTEIHSRFYCESNEEKDVKKIIADMKKSVLQDCTILFSGLIPIREPPEKSEIWKRAQAFGAICLKDFTEDITHVIAAKSGTTKVNKALQTPGTYLVNVKWLTESIRTWTRVPELDYSLEGLPVLVEDQEPPRKRRKPTQSVLEESSKDQLPKTLSSEEESQDEDEMASFLEKELMAEDDQDEL